ncbi:MAG: tetratricopeptide repeat protein [Nitrospinota bacterium]|nr:MAG: tetratricopeptide repeat protein [Nitrospinota bacterium]
MMEQRRLFITLVFILGLVLSVYSNSLQGGFVYDDIYFIKENPLIRSLSNIPAMFTSAFWEASSRPTKSFYRPLVVLSYAVNFALGGFDPFGYHLLNVLLHVANTFLVFLITHHLCRSLPLSATVSLLFGLHPINTEAVAWVSGRTDLLGTLFSLAALVLYISAYPPSASDQPEPKRGRSFWIGSLLAFFLGLFAKENTATIVGVLLLYEFTLRPAIPQKGRRLLPYLVILVAYLGWRMAILGSLGTGKSFVANPLIAEPASARLWTGMVLLGKYLWLLLFPLRLAVDYSLNTIPIAHTPWELRVILPGIAGLGLILLWVRCWKRTPLLSFGLTFFWVTGALIFANALFPFGPILAERFMYLPSVGFVMAVAGLGRWGMAFLPERVRAVAISLLVVAVLAGFSVRTWERAYDWRDDFSLFQSGVAVNPESVIIRYNLGYQYFIRGQFALARDHYLKALEIYPAFFMGYYGLGNIALAEKNYAQAVEYPLQSGIPLSHISRDPYKPWSGLPGAGEA